MLTIADASLTFALPDWIEDKARVCKAEGNRLLIVLDSLHAWADSNDKGATEYDALNIAIESLRALAARLEAPILALCERNRASMKSSGKNAGAGTRKIEYRAETVWDLDRDDDALEDANKRVSVTLKLSKNRQGSPNKKAELQFTGALQQFTEV
jgi:replicative DNA helicase